VNTSSTLRAKTSSPVFARQAHQRNGSGSSRALRSAHRSVPKLEQHFRDVQDVEFTVEQGKLFMLQTRNGKRTGLAAINIAVDMVAEGLISEDDAIKRIPADDLSHVLAPIFDRAAEASARCIGKGLPAGPGAATGRIYFNAIDAVAAADKGEDVVLVRVETSPEDLRGMIAAKGILTSRVEFLRTRRSWLVRWARSACAARPRSSSITITRR